MSSVMAEDETVEPVDKWGVLAFIIMRGGGLGPDVTTTSKFLMGLKRGLINGGPVRA